MRATPDVWLVVRKRETDPPEVWIGDEAQMRELFDAARAQWSDTFLVRVVDGPRDVITEALTSRAAPEQREGADTGGV